MEKTIHQLWGMIRKKEMTEKSFRSMSCKSEVQWKSLEIFGKFCARINSIFACIHGMMVLFHFPKCSLLIRCLFVDKHYSCMICSKSAGLVCVCVWYRTRLIYVHSLIKTKDAWKVTQSMGIDRFFFICS